MALSSPRSPSGRRRRAQQHRDGAQQDAQVERERAVLDVPDVELDPLGPRERGAAVDLRPARQPGLDLEPAALALGVALDLVGERRARADEAHLAAQHVPQLGQLVDRGLAQQVADARDARVALVDRVARALGVGVDDHRAQLQHLERLAVAADALLAEEDRPASSSRTASAEAASSGRRRASGRRWRRRRRAPASPRRRRSSRALGPIPDGRDAPRRDLEQRDHGRGGHEQVVVRHGEQPDAAVREPRGERREQHQRLRAEHPPVDAAAASASTSEVTSSAMCRRPLA